MGISDEYADKLYRELYDKDKEIERLRLALDTIANGPRDAEKTYAELFAEVKIEARTALGAKE